MIVLSTLLVIAAGVLAAWFARSRTALLIAWGITRVIGVCLYGITEPVLRVNVWLKERLCQ